MADYNTFTMVGRIQFRKETENFKVFEEKEYETGWVSRILNMSVLSGTNGNFCTIRGGKFKDEHNSIYTLGKAENGKVEKLIIPFSERLERVGEVAEMSLFTIDEEEYGVRTALAGIIKDLTEDKLSDKGKTHYATVLNISEDLIVKDNLPKFKSKLVESEKKKKKFISEWDFAKEVKEVVSKPEHKDKKWRVYGKMLYSWNKEKNTFYTEMMPTTITLANPEAEEFATSSVGFYFTEDSFQEYDEEKGQMAVNGYVTGYINNKEVKGNMFIPYSVVFKKDTERQCTGIMNKFIAPLGNCEVAKSQIICDLINGTEVKEVTYETLPDEEKEDVDLGLVSLETALDKYKNGVAGNYVRMNRYKDISKSFYSNHKSSMETAYTTEDVANTKYISPANAEEDDDLFF